MLHFNHQDFLTALRVDLGPLLGETGLWALKNYQVRQIEKGNDEGKRKARVAMDLITNYLENGFDSLGKESKYNLQNRFSPKKMAARQVLRSSLPFLYSWMHYAPLNFFESQRKLESDIANAKENKGTAAIFNLCSYCGSPES